MMFCDEIEEQYTGLRQAILAHPFVSGIGDGSLAVERFKFYVRQDYLYLIEYSRVLALAVARANHLEAMGWFSTLLDSTLNSEMKLHEEYCSQFGITRQDLMSTTIAPTTQNYTQFLINTAYQGAYPELVAALMPCQWGYWEIGNHLAEHGFPKDRPAYRQWIEMYTNIEFRELAEWLRNHTNQLAAEKGNNVREGMKKAYLYSLRYEYMFWDMAYKMESWPV